MQTFVIGLPDAYRGGPLEAALHSHGLRYLVSPGVRADRISAQQLSRLVSFRELRILLRRTVAYGELGCALAHREAYQTAIDSSDRSFLFLEDDARLVRGGLTRYLNFMETKTPRVLLLAWDPQFVLTDGVFMDQGILRAAVPPTWTVAYLANRAAVEVLINATSRVGSLADWPIRAMSAVQWFVSVRPHFEPSKSERTTILERTEASNWFVESRLDRLWRIISTILHLKWLLNRSTYGRLQNYWIHEFLRPACFNYLKNQTPLAENKSHARTWTYLFRLLYKSPRIEKREKSPR